MPDLKLLRPLVSFCNVTGLFPFQMEIDTVTNSFKRFSLSFAKVHIWWFMFTILLQVALFVYGLYSIVDEFAKLRETCDSIFLQIGLVLVAISVAVATMTPRIFFFSYRRLESACLLIKQVDDRFWLVDVVPCTTTRQIILFITSTCVSVSTITFHHIITYFS